MSRSSRCRTRLESVIDMITVNSARGARAVDRDHVDHTLDLVRQRELRDMGDHRGAFQRIWLAEGVIRIVHVILRRHNVHAAREQFLQRAMPRRLGSRSRRAEQTRLMCALTEMVMPAVATMSTILAA